MRSRRSTGRLHTCMAALIILLCSTASSCAAANAQGISQLPGTVVDTSGAVIAGATVQVRRANGTVQITTHSDTYGSFIISGLPAGDYRLVVSSPGFETKEIRVIIVTTEAPAPLRISLAVGSVNTTVNVQGREDSLIGIAESATQGTVGATEIQDRPILRSGKVLETAPRRRSFPLITAMKASPQSAWCNPRRRLTTYRNRKAHAATPENFHY